MTNNYTHSYGRYNISEVRKLCSDWGWFLVSGIALIGLGTLAILAPLFSTLSAIIFFGTLLAVAGGTMIISAFWAVRWKGFFLNLLLGILTAVVGVLMILNPKVSALSLTLMLAAFFMFAGLSKIITALAVDFEQWRWMLFSGVVTLILGVLIFSQWPTSALWVIGLFIGIDLLFTGWYFVMLGFAARKCHIEGKIHVPAGQH